MRAKPSLRHAAQPASDKLDRLAWISDVHVVVANREPLDDRRPAHRTDPEQLLAALEGRLIAVARRSWTIEVYSICDADDCRWIQLTLCGQPKYTLTVRMGLNEGVSHALHTLTSWLAKPAHTPRVLNVAGVRDGAFAPARGPAKLGP